MRKITVIFVFIIAFIFAGVGETLAQYTPGTYTGTAVGKANKKHNGHIKVEVTFSETKIEDIKVVEYEQSVEHKKYGASSTEAKTKIPTQLLAKQALGTNVVTKATMASNAIELAVAKAIEQALAEKKYTPGTYTGTAISQKNKKHKHNGHIAVEVTVSESKIEDIKVVEYEQSINHKKYGKAVTEAKTKIPANLLEKQSLDIETVTKATFASNAIELAVAKALQQAWVK
ncbi:MAG: FMN-binding protein [Ignavibacteriae bacterium]|nr:FMN-binding protein [Ignavibacteriota bacterium]